MFNITWSNKISLWNSCGEGIKWSSRCDLVAAKPRALCAWNIRSMVRPSPPHSVDRHLPPAIGTYCCRCSRMRMMPGVADGLASTTPKFTWNTRTFPYNYYFCMSELLHALDASRTQGPTVWGNSAVLYCVKRHLQPYWRIISHIYNFILYITQPVYYERVE